MLAVRVVLGLALGSVSACSLALDFGGSTGSSLDAVAGGDGRQGAYDAGPPGPDGQADSSSIDARPPCLPPDVSDPATGICYMVQTEQRTFAEAEASCVRLGGHLASIHSVLENDLVVSAIDPVGVTWIGFSDAASEGTFVWLDGLPFAFVNWHDLEPNNANGGENCGAIYGSGFGTAAGRWNDALCTDVHASVCRR